MPRRSDIIIAFKCAIKFDPERGQIISTRDFVSELNKLNHFWSLRQANEWITYYRGSFRDYTDHEGEDKDYFLMNMGYVR
ncbi:DNA polymerase V [Buttiauxella sp. B2]|uniref:DNA polymerase V n=1 Tax=Buttiauxella sp. B2 TaxID=2587812 RepID=UPI00112102D5|nr:DNA polymerase V [Buttiauxella sp. B2]TNV19022.1 DNA polymerase V [Buttiauxella sp. B2]